MRVKSASYFLLTQCLNDVNKKQGFSINQFVHIYRIAHVFRFLLCSGGAHVFVNIDSTTSRNAFLFFEQLTNFNVQKTFSLQSTHDELVELETDHRTNALQNSRDVRQ